MTLIHRMVPALLSLLVLAGCGGAPVSGSLEGPWRSEESRLGDTLVVQTLSGSTWGSARLVEDLRIGRLEGEEHEMFGQIGGLAVTPGGEILVYDAQATVVRRYGADGGYRGTLGRAGSGPGEYQNVAGLGVLADGRIVLNDFGNGRFTLYTPDGQPAETWMIGVGGAEMRPLHPHPDGGVFLHTRRIWEGAGRQEQILVHLDARGMPGDTIVIPYTDYRPPALEVNTERTRIGMIVPFAATRGWSVTASGHLVAMLGNRYAIDLHRGDGSILRITRATAPVPVTAEERAAEEANIAARFRRQGVSDWRWDGPSIPATKPPIRWLHTGGDGTVWVRVAQPGAGVPEAERAEGDRTFVREPVVFDVFESDGRFLGQAHAPETIQFLPYPVLSRDRVWAVVRDEDGVNVVVRFRVVPG